MSARSVGGDIETFITTVFMFSYISYLTVMNGPIEIFTADL